MLLVLRIKIIESIHCIPEPVVVHESSDFYSIHAICSNKIILFLPAFFFQKILNQTNKRMSTEWKMFMQYFSYVM